jgi:hypothetical protein
VGGGQSAIEACEAGQRKAHNESHGAKENCGCAAKEMGAGEGEEGRLGDNAPGSHFLEPRIWPGSAHTQELVFLNARRHMTNHATIM